MDERARPLRESDLDPDPVRQFTAWFRAAEEAGIRLPEAMALATATPEGVPSVRMVLLKGFDERGFVFYSGCESRKGRELAANPRAALLLYWDPLGRQVRLEGSVAPLPEEESDAYFVTRPLGSRLAAQASRQSEVIPGRAALEQRVEKLRAEFGSDVPRPPDWGGFQLYAETFEFWQHREDRLHDRFRYRRDQGDAWVIERLAP